jgi:ribosome-associated translation inhibitor RaiA
MKANIYLQDQTCPQPPVVRKFAVKEMQTLIKKDPRITSIHLKLNKIPNAGSANSPYRIQAIAKGQGPTIKRFTHAISPRAALQAIRKKMNRHLVYQINQYAHNSTGAQFKA